MKYFKGNSCLPHNIHTPVLCRLCGRQRLSMKYFIYSIQIVRSDSGLLLERHTCLRTEISAKCMSRLPACSVHSSKSDASGKSWANNSRACPRQFSVLFNKDNTASPSGMRQAKSFTAPQRLESSSSDNFTLASVDVEWVLQNESS